MLSWTAAALRANNHPSRLLLANLFSSPQGERDELRQESGIRPLQTTSNTITDHFDIYVASTNVFGLHLIAI